MGESVEVVTSELQLAADRLRGAGQRLQDGLSSVDLETGNLLASGWKGEAATAFDKYWEQWHNGAGQVVRALQTMSEALDAAAQNYTAADDQASGALESTMQGGGGSGTGGGRGGAPAGGGAPGGAGAPTAGGQTGGSTGSQPGLAEQMNLGQAMAPVSQAAGIPAQFAGQVAGGLMQAGTMAAGAAQQAAQQPEAESETSESEQAEGPPEGSEGGEVPTGPVPVETPRQGADTSGPEATPGRSL